MATALKQPVLRQALEWTPLAEGTFGQPETEGGGSDGGWTKRRAWAGVWAEVAVGDCAASGEWRSPPRQPPSEWEGCAEEDGSALGATLGKGGRAGFPWPLLRPECDVAVSSVDAYPSWLGVPNGSFSWLQTIWGIYLLLQSSC